MRSQQPEQARGHGAQAPLFLARALACSAEVFLHRSSTFGERYIGPQSAVALLLMLVWPSLAPRENPEPMMLFTLAFVVALLAAGAGVARRRRRGEIGPHTRYTGRPRIIGKLNETTVKGVIEPVVVFITGAFLHELSPLVGSYLMLASIGLWMSVQSTRIVERRRVLDLHDAFEEQRRVAEEWRATHDE